MSGQKGRQINSILGLLIRQHYPGLVEFNGVTQPPWTWAHFYAAEDSEHGSVAGRIKAEFWVSLHRTKFVKPNAFIGRSSYNETIHDVCMQDFFTCEPGHEEKAAQVQDRVCRARLGHLYHETRLQCIINHRADVFGEKVSKSEARGMTLTREEYELVSMKHQYYHPI